MKNALDKEEIKFWFTIMAIVVSITIWGVRIESKLDKIAEEFALHTVDQNKQEHITLDSLNRVWKNLTVLDERHAININDFTR